MNEIEKCPKCGNTEMEYKFILEINNSIIGCNKCINSNIKQCNWCNNYEQLTQRGLCITCHTQYAKALKKRKLKPTTTERKTYWKKKYQNKKPCNILSQHEQDLQHDPNRLSRTFISELIQIDCDWDKIPLPKKEKTI